MNLEKEFRNFNILDDYYKFIKKEANLVDIRQELQSIYKKRVEDGKNVGVANICVINFSNGEKGYLPHFACEKVFRLLMQALKKKHSKPDEHAIHFFRKVFFE